MRLYEFAPSPERDHNDDVPDPIFVLANRWWNAADKQPQIENVLRSLGWSIHQVESEDDAVQLQHRDGTIHFISADDFDPELHEDWKTALGGAALAGAMALGGGAVNAKMAAPVAQAKAPTTQVQAPAQQAAPVEQLKKVATASGIAGTELAQFLAQCAHETANFASMEERGSPAYFTKKYEQNPRKAKILGNKVKGDGERYKGRGFIQLTGRDNYTRAGDALGLPLAQQPDLAARPDVAAKVAVWYWQNRVAPKIKDFSNTGAVTKKINPASKGLQSRQDQFKSYQVAQR
jgi:predicted chitinase